MDWILFWQAFSVGMIGYLAFTVARYISNRGYRVVSTLRREKEFLESRLPYALAQIGKVNASCEVLEQNWIPGGGTIIAAPSPIAGDEKEKKEKEKEVSDEEFNPEPYPASEVDEHSESLRD